MSIYHPFESSNNDPQILPLVSPLIQVNSTQVIGTTSISRGLINPVNPNDHQAKNIRLTLIPQAIRQNKFDFASGQFDQGYPFNDVYYFCDQNLTSVYKYGSIQWTKNYINNEQLIVSGNNTSNLCGSILPCNTICPSGLTLDPVSCSCVPPPECIPQVQCTPAPVSVDLKNIIHGYAYYLSESGSVPVPGFGNIPVTCWGGHACCATKFKPTILTSDGDTIEANRSISMDNAGGAYWASYNCNSGGQIPTEGFIPNSSFDRSDTFSFIVPDTSVLPTSEFYLDCLQSQCHDGVTMVFLVGETLSGEPVLLFASCVTPNEVGAKPIGTIDCDNESEPVLCTPTLPTSPPPTPTPDPTPTLYLQLGGCLPNEAWLEGRPQLASFMNTLFDSTRSLELTINENGTFSAIESDTLILDGGQTTYQVQVGGNIDPPPGYIYITVALAGLDNINGTTTIVSMQWQQSLENNTDPYSTIPILNTNYLGAAGWMSLAFYGCTNWDIIVNP